VDMVRDDGILHRTAEVKRVRGRIPGDGPISLPLNQPVKSLTSIRLYCTGGRAVGDGIRSVKWSSRGFLAGRRTNEGGIVSKSPTDVSMPLSASEKLLIGHRQFAFSVAPTAASKSG
jgi:hypothetical protein